MTPFARTGEFKYRLSVNSAKRANQTRSDKGFLDARLSTKYIYRKASEMHSHCKSLKYGSVKR